MTSSSAEALTPTLTSKALALDEINNIAAALANDGQFRDIKNGARSCIDTAIESKLTPLLAKSGISSMVYYLHICWTCPNIVKMHQKVVLRVDGHGTYRTLPGSASVYPLKIHSQSSPTLTPLLKDGPGESHSLNVGNVYNYKGRFSLSPSMDCLIILLAT